MSTGSSARDHRGPAFATLVAIAVLGTISVVLTKEVEALIPFGTFIALVTPVVLGAGRRGDRAGP